MFLLIQTACLVFGLQTIAFLLSVKTGKNSIADVFWGLTHAIAAAWIILPLASAFIDFNPLLMLANPSTLIASFSIIWGLRLSWHIGRRFVSKKAEDPRYTEMTKNWNNYFLRSYLQVFLLQGLLILLMLSALIVSLSHSTIPNLYFVGVGAAVWLFGFGVEILADSQLARFIKNPKKSGLMRTGLWRCSRHPNYFGEVMCWWGIWLITLPTPYWYLSLITPVTITILILKVSGVPLSEKSLAYKKNFADYAARTNKFFPWWPKE